MKYSAFLVAAAIGAHTIAVHAGCVEWSALPWEDLQLSSNATLLTFDDPSAAYDEECYSEVFRLVPYGKRIAYHLSDQPSGLCMNQLACAFQQCTPLDPETTTVEERLDTLIGEIEAPFGNCNDSPCPDLPYYQEQWDEYIRGENEFFNLPSTVIFPALAMDVIAAITFARDNGVEISVKTSGNSYTGASTKRNTLHLNMNKKYPSYSNMDGGIIDCDEVEDVAVGTDFLPDLSDQPCRVAKSRDKHGVIRIGGGEQFWLPYQAVTNFNAAYKKSTGGSSKFRFLGGAAGTVSPMGWTFQGGLASTTGGRMLGFGVDQVVQIEMVLPTGKHVKFGPTEWDDSAIYDGYLQPKTITVSGVCNKNTDEDEALWVWEECEGDIPWNDLWFAVRGGLGGSWGVVLSLTIQLQPWEPTYFLHVPDPQCKENMNYPDARNRFVIDFLLNPSELNVSETDSKKCQGFRGDNIFCYGEGSWSPFINAWNEFAESYYPDLVGCFEPLEAEKELRAYPDDPDDTFAFEDYASFAKQPYYKNYPDLAGLVPSYPYPSYMSTNEASINILVPAQYYIDNEEAANLFPPSYLAFGGNAAYTSDQLTALSQAHRTAGNMAGTALKRFDDNDFWSDVFPKMFDTSDPENFPGFVGSNHAGPNTRGPLKENWTKACPLSWTTEERDEKCISIQEAIYGTKLLKELERIKMEIDPNFIFDCYGCILNNRDRSNDPSCDDELTILASA